VVIPAGSLDDETPVRPQARIFTGSRASWSCSGDASADFEGRGLAATNIRYRARVTSASSAAEIAALLRETDAVAEVHNTLRTGPAVTLEQ